MTLRRRPIMAIIGRGSECTPEQIELAETLGEKAVDNGFRIITGGLGGVMSAACRGAHRSSSYREGDTIGMLPGASSEDANQWTDIPLPTGLGVTRNVLVVRVAQVVVAVGGGAGTLSEMAMAWQLDIPIIALDKSDGWAQACAGQALDNRRDDVVHEAVSPADAIRLANLCLQTVNPDIRST